MRQMEKVNYKVVVFGYVNDNIGDLCDDVAFAEDSHVRNMHTNTDKHGHTGTLFG